jgi:hypothetical protein
MTSVSLHTSFPGGQSSCQLWARLSVHSRHINPFSQPTLELTKDSNSKLKRRSNWMSRAMCGPDGHTHREQGLTSVWSVTDVVWKPGAPGWPGFQSSGWYQWPPSLFLCSERLAEVQNIKPSPSQHIDSRRPERKSGDGWRGGGGAWGTLAASLL